MFLGFCCRKKQSTILDEITTQTIGDKVRVYILNSFDELNKLKLNVNQIKLIFVKREPEEICEISKLSNQSWLSEDGSVKIKVLMKQNQYGDLQFQKDPQFYEQLQKTTKQLNNNRYLKDNLNIYLEFGKISKQNNLQMIKQVLKQLCCLNTIRKFSQIRICFVESVKLTKNRIVDKCRQINRNKLLTSSYYQSQQGGSNIFQNYNNQTVYNSILNAPKEQLYNRSKGQSKFQSINEEQEVPITEE